MVDYTRDQLIQGLRAAHDAGDTAAATAFAGRIQALGNAPSAPAAPTAPQTPLLSVGSQLSDWQGQDKAGEFVGKMADAATGGLGAKALDALGLGQGPGGQTVAQQVQSAGQDIGPLASAGADVAGYALGPGLVGVGSGLGKLAASGLAKGIGENIASRVGGRMIGSGIENAGATLIGSAGHDENLSTGDLLKSLALGTVTGVLPGGKERLTTPSQADLLQTSQKAYAPLAGKDYVPGQVAGKIATTTGALDPGMASKSTGAVQAKANDIIDLIKNSPTATADHIASYQQALNNVARTDLDRKIADQYIAALNKGVGSQTAETIAKANKAYSAYKTAGEIGDWAASPGSAAKEISSALEKKPYLYKNQPGVFEALSKIAQPPSVAKVAMNKALQRAAGAAVGAGGGYLLGNNPAEDIAGAVAGGAILPAIFASLHARPIARSLLAARHLAATGQQVDPSVYGSRLPAAIGALARQSGYGLGAGGAIPGPGQ